MTVSFAFCENDTKSCMCYVTTVNDSICTSWEDDETVIILVENVYSTTARNV